MLLRQFRLGSNLPMHIRENTDFPWEKPLKLPSAKANFEGCGASSYFKLNGRPSIVHRPLI